MSSHRARFHMQQTSNLPNEPIKCIIPLPPPKSSADLYGSCFSDYQIVVLEKNLYMNFERTISK